MAMNSTPNAQKGFALLIAVIFMSVMLSFGLALATLSYKQQVLASNAVASQAAFYAADTALECVLYVDQRSTLLAYPPSDPSSAPTMICDGIVAISSSETWSPSRWVVKNRFSLNDGGNCADVTVYKPNGVGTTYLFSQGYNTPCAVVDDPSGGRFVMRGITVRY